MSNTLKFGNGEWYGKEGTILAYNDENNNYKPLLFNFERASSATRVNKQGLIETVGADQPRIDYLNDSNGALLLEPSRTNLVTNSENFAGSGWNNFASITPIANSTISPEGVQNASTLECSGNNVFRYSFTASSSTNYVGSVFVKSKETTNDFGIQTLESGTAYTSVFNIESGVVVTQASNHIANIEDYGNGWFRCSVKFNSGSSTSNIFDFKGSQTIDNKEFYAWGAQLEAGSYPTSIINTKGSAVTRSRDLSDTQNLSHVIGQTEGVIFYDAILVHKSTSAAEDLFELSIDDVGNNNAFFINNYNNTLTIIFKSGGSNSFYNNSFNPTEGARYKLAFAYKQNDFALYINGNQIATDSNGTVPSMNQITFGNYYNNSVNLSSSVNVNDFKLYNTRLSNSELAALTQV